MDPMQTEIERTKENYSLKYIAMAGILHCNNLFDQTYSSTV